MSTLDCRWTDCNDCIVVEQVQALLFVDVTIQTIKPCLEVKHLDVIPRTTSVFQDTVVRRACVFLVFFTSLTSRRHVGRSRWTGIRPPRHPKLWMHEHRVLAFPACAFCPSCTETKFSIEGEHHSTTRWVSFGSHEYALSGSQRPCTF